MSSPEESKLSKLFFAALHSTLLGSSWQCGHIHASFVDMKQVEFL